MNPQLFLESIYWADIADIVIIAVFSYIAILFLRQTRSLLAFAGIGILAVIYVLAQTFDLYITTLLLQSFFSIFVIILIIIFQDELKRSFEMIAASGTRKIKQKSFLSFSSTIFAIIQATSNLMRKKNGALIVIPGKELTERHIRGGSVLDGIVTAPLLESIFDPQSPGHDGAAIISKDRISKFGAHLPLSHNLKQTKDRGTRHSAAVGISEKTDALAVVISEERGEVSVAKNGRLKTLKRAEDLEKHLIEHYKEKFPEKPKSFLRNLFEERLIEKVSAILIACLAWFFIAFQAEIVQRDFNVPISYTGVSEEKIIESTHPDNVTITLSARGQTVLNRMDPDSLRVSIPGEEIDPGTTEIELERRHITHPFNVSVINIDPSAITVQAEVYSLHEVRIEPDIAKIPEEMKVKKFSIDPGKVKILVPQDTEPPQQLTTEEIALEEIKEEVEARIVVPEEYKLHQDSPRSVIMNFFTEE